MTSFVFPQQAIDFLQKCEFSPAATMSYELISGSVSWSDERYSEFVGLCRETGCLAYGKLFAYRTSILVDRPRDEFRLIWVEVRQRCPEWIGFRSERVTADARFESYVRDMQDNF